MTDAIPDFDRMTPAERTALAAEMRKRAAELEKQGEAAQAKLVLLAEETAKTQAEVDECNDKSYHLRRMAHSVEAYSSPPP